MYIWFFIFLKYVSLRVTSYFAKEPTFQRDVVKE